MLHQKIKHTHGLFLVELDGVVYKRPTQIALKHGLPHQNFFNEQILSELQPQFIAEPNFIVSQIEL